MASHREFQVFAMIQRLVELDADAVDAYAVAVERARDAGWRPSLIHFQDDHERQPGGIGFNPNAPAARLNNARAWPRW